VLVSKMAGSPRGLLNKTDGGAHRIRFQRLKSDFDAFQGIEPKKNMTGDVSKSIDF